MSVIVNTLRSPQLKNLLFSDDASSARVAAAHSRDDVQLPRRINTTGSSSSSSACSSEDEMEAEDESTESAVSNKVST